MNIIVRIKVPVNSFNDIELSIVCPAHNEQENLRALVEDIEVSVAPLGVAYEIVIVDDGSTDATPVLLCELMAKYSVLRAVRMVNTPVGRGHGQSAAFHAGFRVARGNLLAVMDADLQNDPRDLSKMLELMKTHKADVVQGDRSQARADTLVRRVTSVIGRLVRRVILGDTVRDTGCSLRIMRREVALALPLQFRGMHRFIPITARHLGYTVVEVSVNHRPRVAGKAKYGVWNRALPGLIDCFAVRWMKHRRRCVDCKNVE